MSHLEDSVTAIHVVWQLVQSGISTEDIPEKVSRHRATVYRWITGIRLHGINEYIRQYRDAKKGHRHTKTNAIVRTWIYSIREQRRQCCDKFVVLKPVETLDNGNSQIECIAHSPSELFATSPTFRRLAELEGVRL